MPLTHIENSKKQGAADDDAVTNIVRAMDSIFARLGIDDAIFHNPSYQSDIPEKVCGLTNTYLKPVRIGRKAIVGDVILYYGQKVDPFPKAYEIVDFDAASDIVGFLEKRMAQTVTEYMSVHAGNYRLDIDIREGVIADLRVIGLTEEFDWLKAGDSFRLADLQNIITTFMHY
jgi:hypothetical protein